MSTSNDNQPTDRQRHEDGVIDQAGSWEDALRAGQREDGGAGSVDAELGVLHLLRHAAAPEVLADDRLDAIWAQGPGAEVDPWWKRAWSGHSGWIAGAAALAGAAAVLLIVLPTRNTGDSDGAGGNPAIARAETSQPPTQAEMIERQFALLAPRARAQLGREVDVSRDTLRGDLMADAVAAAAPGSDVGGAP